MPKTREIKIYLAGSMAAGRDFESGIKLISEKLEKLGCKIITKNNVVQNNKNSIKPINLRNRKYIMKRDKKWLKSSDLVIAEVSQYSHGVGYEHAYAEFQGKPILLLRSKALIGQKYSAFLDGTDYKKLMFSFYDAKNLDQILGKFINRYS
jgi:nucleoside 2-deoxyribosyltransferase